MLKSWGVLLLNFVWFSVNAQLNLQISGQVTDTADSPLSYATVKYIALQDTANTLTGEDGKFTIRHITASKFRIIVTMKGYLRYTQSYETASRLALRLPAIRLHTDYLDLDPITVSRTRPLTITEDTVSYNVSAFPVRDGSEVVDILKRLPGVEIDVDGNVLVQGKKLEKVLVNGKEFFGGDVSLTISNLPANIVEKLQIIDDYGDRARLTGIRIGDPAKVLNIVFKKGKNNGQFGHALTGEGTSGKYSEDAFANDFRGDRQLSATANAVNNAQTGSDPGNHGALSYADVWDKNWRGGLNMVGAEDAPSSKSSINQTSHYPGNQIQTQQKTTAEGHNQNLSGGGVLTFKFDQYSTFRITPSFSRQGSNQQSAASSGTLEQDSGFRKSTNRQSTYASHGQGLNAGTDLYFEKTNPLSKKRFSAEIKVHYVDTRQFTNQQSLFNILTDSVPSTSILHYLVSNNTYSLAVGLQIHYFLPVSREAFLEFGYNTQSLSSREGQETQSPDSVTGQFLQVDSLTLTNRYQTVIQQLHTEYTAKYGKVALSMGLNGQAGMLSGTIDGKDDQYTYKYITVLPLAQVNWKFTQAQSLSFHYAGENTQPTLQQISPITDVTNPQYPVTGNPSLKPSYTHAGSLNYENAALRPTQFRGFGVALGYAITLDPILTSIILPKETGQVIQTATYLNAGQSTAWFANYHFTLPAFLHTRIRISGNGGLTGSQNLTVADNDAYTSRSLIWSQALHLQLLIPGLIDADAQGNYSLTHYAYGSPSQIPGSVQNARMIFRVKQYFFHTWSITGMYSEIYNSDGHILQPTPALCTATLQRDFLPHNRATIALTIYNILNSTAATSQSMSPTVISQTQTTYAGRHFLITFQFKLQRFKGE